VDAPRTIIIDTDPGQDDAVAILLALAAPEALDIRAITTVAGNMPLDVVTRNACALLELAGRTDVPVHAGCDAPWQRAPVTAAHVHGESGLDGANLPIPQLMPGKAHAVDVIIRAATEAPNRGLTLCALGPLTNIATALVRTPEIKPKIHEIVLMGGAIGLGNITPSAEFNIYADPHAAAAVFAAGVPIVMLPLEATHQVLATAAWADRMLALGTHAGRMIGGMYGHATRTRHLRRHKGRGVPLHDPCVIGYLLWPELFAGTECYVAVETAGELTMGRTVVDRWGTMRRPPNALVIERVDADALLTRLSTRISRLP